MYRFKNTTSNSILHSVSGINFKPNEYVSLSRYDVIFVFDSQMIAWLIDGTFIFNDGTTDYNYADAIAHLSWSGLARKIYFDNSGNSFSANNVQDAIEEIGNIWFRGGATVPPHSTSIIDTIDTDGFLGAKYIIYIYDDAVGKVSTLDLKMVLDNDDIKEVISGKFGGIIQYDISTQKTTDAILVRVSNNGGTDIKINLIKTFFRGV